MKWGKKQAAWLSVASNTALTFAKLAAGFVTGSVSILSEALHSGLDLVAAGIATYSVHAADRPPDEDHPYGHEKIENISGVVEGLLIFAAAGWIIYESVDRLLHGGQLRRLSAGIAVMAASALVNVLVAGVLMRTGRKERSVALEADAVHLLTDVWTSVGVLLGFALISAARKWLHYDLNFLDPLIALGVAALILKSAFRITGKSFAPLLDSAASEKEKSAIAKILEEFSERGVDFHKLRTRRAGGSLHVDFHMGCKPGTSLEQGHAVSHELKARVEQELPGAKVLVHVEPSSKALVFPEDHERVLAMKEELLSHPRVKDVCSLKASSYLGETRVEAELCLDPGVTMAESAALSDELRERLSRGFPEVKEVALGFRPAGGWQEAIPEEDQKRIRELLGEHERALAGVHELRVSAARGRREIHLRLAVPRRLPVEEAHKIGEHLKSDLKSLFPEGAEIDIHLEPCDGDCPACKAECPEREAG